MLVSLRLQVHQQLRDELAKVKTLEGLVAVNRELKLHCQVSADALCICAVALNFHGEKFGTVGPLICQTR